jgi:hypothetical protein
MLTVTDFGCRLHQQRHLSFMGEEAEVMGGVLHNLPQSGECHFYVCEYGHSHRVSFNEDHISFVRLPASTRRQSARGL